MWSMVVSLWLRQTIYALALVSGCCLTLDCASPTSPSSNALPLLAGPNWLVLIGVDMSDDPTFPPCSPIAVPRAGKQVTTLVMLARTSSDWTGRSSSPTENLESPCANNP